MEKLNLTGENFVFEQEEVVTAKDRHIRYFRYLTDLYSFILMVGTIFIKYIPMSIRKYFAIAYIIALILKTIDSTLGLSENDFLRKKYNTYYDLNFFVGYFCQYIISAWSAYRIFLGAPNSFQIINDFIAITVLNICHRTNLLENAVNKFYTLILILGFFLWNILKNAEILTDVLKKYSTAINVVFGLLLTFQSLRNSGAYRAAINLSTLTKIIILLSLIAGLTVLFDKKAIALSYSQAMKGHGYSAAPPLSPSAVSGAKGAFEPVH